MMTAWKRFCQTRFGFLGEGQLQVENDLGLPDTFFPADMQLMMGGAFDDGFYGMAAFIIGFPSNRSLKGLCIQEKKIEITKQEPLRVKEIDEFVEPVDQEFFQIIRLKGNCSGLF